MVRVRSDILTLQSLYWLVKCTGVPYEFYREYVFKDSKSCKSRKSKYQLIYSTFMVISNITSYLTIFYHSSICLSQYRVLTTVIFNNIIYLMLALANICAIISPYFYDFQLYCILKALKNIDNRLTSVMHIKPVPTNYALQHSSALILHTLLIIICVYDIYVSLNKWDLCSISYIYGYLLYYTSFLIILNVIYLLRCISKYLKQIKTLLTQNVNEYLTLPLHDTIQLEGDILIINGWIKEALEKRKDANLTTFIRSVSFCMNKIDDLMLKFNKLYGSFILLFIIFFTGEWCHVFNLLYVYYNETSNGHKWHYNQQVVIVESQKTAFNMVVWIINVAVKTYIICICRCFVFYCWMYVSKFHNFQILSLVIALSQRWSYQTKT